MTPHELALGLSAAGLLASLAALLVSVLGPTPEQRDSRRRNQARPRGRR